MDTNEKISAWRARTKRKRRYLSSPSAITRSPRGRIAARDWRRMANAMLAEAKGIENLRRVLRCQTRPDGTNPLRIFPS
jgi:hypothetical protein